MTKKKLSIQEKILKELVVIKTKLVKLTETKEDKEFKLWQEKMDLLERRIEILENYQKIVQPSVPYFPNTTGPGVPPWWQGTQIMGQNLANSVSTTGDTLMDGTKHKEK